MMFMSDVHKREECMQEALHDLRKFGVKSRPKKSKPRPASKESNHKAFKLPLRQLQMLTVTLKSGQQIVVPKLVHELCSFILTQVKTEGIFRKEGSKNRQLGIKKLLDSGKPLGMEHHVVDVAVVLKLFLRELPEPLIPYGYHELFLRCVLLEKKKLDAIILACLLLPMEHLNTLSYLMLFLNQVSEFAEYNKMTAYNLAVVIGPTLFPVEEKISPNPQLRMAKTCELFTILIENAPEVGVIPEAIIDRLSKSGSIPTEEPNKKKKRRSGSLTRMFSGLKKIVGGNKSDDEKSTIVTPDLLMTPINTLKQKRRISNGGFSNKKKKDLISKLPDNVLLNTPFTPISMNQEGNKEDTKAPSNNNNKDRDRKWFGRSKSVKNLTKDAPEIKKVTLERRWSGLTNQASNIRKTKKRNSCAASLAQKTATQTQQPITEPDYIRVPIEEYVEIKNRVSAMERRISQELENVKCHTTSDLKSVQTVYEQTLNQAEHLSPTTDHLAKRLSRELKIRTSTEQKIIRSPSARKIGSIRRRSRELETKNNQSSSSSSLIRHQSWHLGYNNQLPRVSLKRGKPNTVLSGLPIDFNLLSQQDNLKSSFKRARTVENDLDQQLPKLPKSLVSCNLSGSSNDTWVSAENFFATLKSCNTDDSQDSHPRPSLAKLRSQNAGMVLAKAKLFDKIDSSNSSSNNSSSGVRKSVARRNGDGGNKIGYRVRVLRQEERACRKSVSPRKRQLGKLQAVNIPLQNNKENVNSGCTADISRTPRIKKSLGMRSPKRICKSPRAERNTPLRVLKTPSQNV